MPTASAPPAPATAGLPSVPTQCIDKCQSVFKTCLKMLLLSDGGRPSPEVFANCEQAQSKCRKACVQP
jgi:hypothetical protein